MEDNRIDIMPVTRYTCPICGDRHGEGGKHNIHSLYYRRKFYMAHGRFPTDDDTGK